MAATHSMSRKLRIVGSPLPDFERPRLSAAPARLAPRCTAAPHLFGPQARSYGVRYLEPGRRRRRRRPPLTGVLWLLAAGLAVALAVQVILR